MAKQRLFDFKLTYKRKVPMTNTKVVGNVHNGITNGITSVQQKAMIFFTPKNKYLHDGIAIDRTLSNRLNKIQIINGNT